MFLFFCAASLFGTLISQVNEILANQAANAKELESVLETYLAVEPRHGDAYISCSSCPRSAHIANSTLILSVEWLLCSPFGASDMLALTSVHFVNTTMRLNALVLTMWHIHAIPTLHFACDRLEPNTITKTWAWERFRFMVHRVKRQVSPTPLPLAARWAC